MRAGDSGVLSTSERVFSSVLAGGLPHLAPAIHAGAAMRIGPIDKGGVYELE
jgi:hypothetical protein